MFSVYQHALQGSKDFACQVQFRFIPSSPFSYMLLWKLTELIYGMRTCMYITLKNPRLCIGQKYELVKLKNQGKVRQKKKNCAAILASFNMPYQGFTKYI